MQAREQKSGGTHKTKHTYKLEVINTNYEKKRYFKALSKFSKKKK